jgi:hypothetical protein
MENHPLAPAVDALRTVTGRVVLIFAAVLIGAALGGFTATRELSGAWGALSGFFPWAAASFLYSVGIVSFSATLIFALLFIRREWPLWTVAAVTLLMWWNAHETIYYLLHEGAGARALQKVDAVLQDLPNQRRP